MSSNPAIQFFIELWNRLQIKSPKIFRVLQLIFASATFAGYVPSMLQRWFNIEVPGNIITLCEDVSKYSAGFFAGVCLPIVSKPVGQTTEGSPIIVPDEKRLPFTAAAEKKKVEDTVPPPEVIPEVPEQPINKP